MSFVWKHKGFLLLNTFTIEHILGTDIFDLNVYIASLRSSGPHFANADMLQKEFNINKKSIEKYQHRSQEVLRKSKQKLKSFNPYDLITSLLEKLQLREFTINSAKFNEHQLGNLLLVWLVTDIDFQFQCDSFTDIIQFYKILYDTSNPPYMLGDWGSVLNSLPSIGVLPDVIEYQFVITYKDKIVIYEQNFVNQTSFINPRYIAEYICYNPYTATIILTNFIDKVLLKQNISIKSLSKVYLEKQLHQRQQQQRSRVQKLNQRETQLGKREEELKKWKSQKQEQYTKKFSQLQDQHRERTIDLKKKQQDMTSFMNQLLRDIGDSVQKYITIDQFRRDTRPLPHQSHFDTSGITTLYDLLIKVFPTHRRTSSFKLYHGTENVSRRSIKSQGIRLQKNVISAHGRGFYVSPIPSVAYEYACSRHGMRPGCSNRVIFEWLISPEAAKQLKNDIDFNWAQNGEIIVFKSQDAVRSLHNKKIYILE